MSTNTSIEWTDTTWSPVTGCDRVSPGCDNCYALTMARRLKAMGSAKYQRDGNPRTSGPGFGVSIHPDVVNLPLTWRRPRRVFVNSMADLFHQDVDQAWIADVFAVMAAAGRHTFQVLTKRHARMRHILNDPAWVGQVRARAIGKGLPAEAWRWPIPNVWLGVSVETQQWADLRIPALLATPAAVRFLSCEPLLGPVDLTRLAASSTQQPDMVYDSLGQRYGVPGRWQAATSARLDWVIVGGESGAKARPMHPDWARSLRDQCAAAGVPYFFKQHGQWAPLGPLYGDLEETDDGHLEAVGLEVVEGKQVIQLESDGYIAEGHQPGDTRTWLMARVGKRRAGRELDGRTHDAYPNPVRSA